MCQPGDCLRAGCGALRCAFCGAKVMFLAETNKEKDEKIKETEIMLEKKGKKYKFMKMGQEEFENRIRNKWLKKLEKEQEES